EQRRCSCAAASELRTCAHAVVQPGLGISLLLGFIFGFVYLGAEYETYQSINSGLGMVYLSTMFIALVSFMSGLPLVYEERSVFYRERAAQT
ncbi:ATP-binding Cassette (ABC) Superfamily, partial [Phytophthora cinnamomi]|uniref:ATP-binding Cassette (ABC) Superfamily n=1 Tax=Phytophthora cinnamomi TaxID=4785 RepID=UPI00355A96A5